MRQNANNTLMAMDEEFCIPKSWKEKVCPYLPPDPFSHPLRVVLSALKSIVQIQLSSIVSGKDSSKAQN